MPEYKGYLDSGLSCLTILCRLHGIAVNPEQLAHEYAHSGKSFNSTQIILAAKGLGLKARLINLGLEKLPGLHLPVIAVLKKSDQQTEYVLIGKIFQDSIVVQSPGDSKPQTIALTSFEKLWTGDVILLAKRAGLEAKDKKFDFSWFYPVILKYKKLFAEVLLATIIIQLFALVTPLFFQVIIDKVLVHKGITTLNVLIIGLLIVSFFDVLLNVLRNYLLANTTNRIDVILGAKLFKHMMTLPISYFASRRVGDTVARVRELENIRQFLTGSALLSAIDVLFIFIFLLVMFYYSSLLSWIVMATIPLYAVLSVVITPILRSRIKEKFNRGADNQAFLVENITGIETVKTSSIEPQAQKQWEEQLAGYVKASFKATNLGNITNQIASFINKMMVLMILWIGAHQVMDGELSVGMLVAFNMLAARVSGPILKVVQLWQEFQQAGISVRRLADILNETGEAKLSAAKGSLANIKGKVEFENISFRYRADGAEVLRDISFKVEAGEIIGIVGHSGSGKSTLTKMIQRLYVPDSGKILLDDVNLAMVDPNWLRRQIGVVLQENFLFNRSIRENIALMEPGISIDEVVNAARIAGAHDFILELAEGYDTLVGERGSNLSGGQRQRIAIARAIISNPKILIFDEATSALDYESERIIESNMSEIARERTVFIIAHRLTAVRNATNIFVLEHGQIAEQGNHQQLMQHGGIYARLWGLQSQ